MTEDRQQRLNEIAAIAVRTEEETQLPAQQLIAQWALESAWGAQPVGHANYFGIKKVARHTMSCMVETHEMINGKLIPFDCQFADYPSLEDSCRDYAWMITQDQKYRDPWQRYLKTRDRHQLTFDIAQIYATNTRYWQLATEIAGQQNVADAISHALVDQESSVVRT